MPSLLLQSLFPLVFIMLLGWLSGKLGYMYRTLSGKRINNTV